MYQPSPTFVLLTRRFVGTVEGIEFTYGLGDDTFTETFTFNDPIDPILALDSPRLEHLLDVAHLCVGVSYYKLAMAGRIRFELSTTQETLGLVSHLYDHGLRELAVRNNLSVPLAVSVEAPQVRAAPQPGAVPAEPRALVPFGGGKDSTLVLTLLDAPTALSIHPTPVQRRVATAAGLPLLEVQRRIDPLLAQRTAEGGRNGHIPITAINSSVSAIVAALTGHHDVVMANERSAEEPTAFVDGIPVNHQYSKTFAFESALAEALVPGGVRYFSLLRQWSELGIAGALAHNESLRVELLSCNRAFSMTRPTPDPTWCRDCAKCRFTFLCFATFLEPTAATAMFGGNMLDDVSQVDGFRALWADKPFDCVGELAESALAMAYLAEHPAWRSCTVVAELADEASDVAARSGTSLAELLKPSGDNLVPPEYREPLERAERTITLTGNNGTR